MTNPGSLRRMLRTPAAILTVTAGLPGAGLSVNALAIDPTSPSTIYAQATASPGGTAFSPVLFKSTDGGGTWSMVSSIIAVTALVIDSLNSSTLYAGTSQGILKSTNGGANWTDASSGLPGGTVTRLAIDPLTPSTLYTVIFTGNSGFIPTVTPPQTLIFKTTNGGTSWSALDPGLPAGAFVNLLVIDPSTPSNLYLLVPPSGPPVNGTPPKGVLLKSMDGGASWSQLAIPLPQGPPSAFISSLAIDPTNSSTLYAVLPSFGGPSAAGGILKSTDGGGTWTQLPALPANTSISSLIIDPSAPTTIYTYGSSFTPPGPPKWRILKSTDGGQNWSTLDPGIPANTFLTSLALDPMTPAIYAGYSAIIGPVIAPGPASTLSGGVVKSTDGAQTWKDSSAGLISYDIRALATSSSASSALYAGGASGVFRSTDGGANWRATSVSGFTSSLVADAVNPNLVYAQTGKLNGCNSDDHLLLASSDAGANWTNTVSPQNSGCILSATFPSVHAAPMVTGPTNSATIYLGESDDVDGYSAVLKSADGGANWSVVWDWFLGLRIGVRALAIDPAHTSTIYLGVDDGSLGVQAAAGSTGLLKSTDGGATWSNTGVTQSAVNLLAIDPSNANIIYAAAEGHYSEPKGFQGLFKSTDGGVKWQAINKGLDSVIGNRSITATALKIDPAGSNILYLGTSTAGVFRSIDGGATWTAFDDGLANLQIRALAVDAGASRALYAGTAGGIFKIPTQ